MKHEFKKLFFVICDLKIWVTREELELLINIHDFTTLFLVILSPPNG